MRGTSRQARLYDPGALLCILSAALGAVAWIAIGPRFFGPSWSAPVWLAGLLAGAGSCLGGLGTLVFLARPGACRSGVVTHAGEFVRASGLLAFGLWGAAVGLLLLGSSA